MTDPKARPVLALLRDMALIDVATPTDPLALHQVPAVAVVHASLWHEIADALTRLHVMENGHDR